jgi:drug/metabolite transporter (DMT)-like permease
MILSPVLVAAVAAAAAGAVFLAVGTHLQHLSVTRGRGAGTAVRLAVLRSPVWLLGTALIAAETVLNILALGLAPVALVQPVGALSLVCAALISARALRVPLTRRLLASIALTTGSIAVFVGLTARCSLPAQVSEEAAGTLVLLLCLGAAAAVALARSNAGHLARVGTAGVLFGTVASGAHLAAAELFTRSGDWGALSPSVWLLVLALAPASGAGMWLVQTAYASGPPETVLAGLTVVDPLTAVAVGALLLGEYAPMPPEVLSLLIVSALVAFAGIGMLARHHPGVGGRAAAEAVPASLTASPAAGVRAREGAVR